MTQEQRLILECELGRRREQLAALKDKMFSCRVQSGSRSESGASQSWTDVTVADLRRQIALCVFEVRKLEFSLGYRRNDPCGAKSINFIFR